MSKWSIHYPGGHQNQAGGCCCPICGNTCGFHPEYDKSDPPEGYATHAEWIHEQIKIKKAEDQQKLNRRRRNSEGG